MGTLANPRAGEPYTPDNDAERAFLRSYDPTKFPPFAVTADIVLLTVRAGELCVLLVQRGDAPYAGSWALPGGFVNHDEDLEDAARRELREETGMDNMRGHLEQLGTYGRADRDPRMRVVSVAYLALLPDLPAPQHGSDAADAKFWRIADLRSENVELAFDHATILTDAVNRAASKLEYTPLATTFCDPEFTIGELQSVYEAVWQTRLDKPNFRRWVLGRDGFVDPVAKPPRVGSSGGRPGALYRAGNATLLNPPLLRPEPSR